MMNSDIQILRLSEFQVLPPFTDDVRFERFIVDLFNSIEKTTSYSRFGRNGQKQYGLDVRSIEKGTVIQCKVKSIDGADKKIRDKLLAELESDFDAFIKYRKTNKLKYSKFIFASTFKNDTHIQTECDKKSNNNIIVDYWSWDRLLDYVTDDLLLKYHSIFIRPITQYYNDKSAERKKTKEKLQKLPLIDKIHFLTKRFYPLAVLKQDSIPSFYPFDENLNPKQSHFINCSSFKIANDETAESLKQWNNDLLNKPSPKVLDIFSFLSNNLILNISGISIRKFNINSISTQSSCLISAFDNLDLALLDEKIISNNTDYLKNDSTRNQMENAYVNYMTLNLSDAYNQIKQILDSVKNEKDEEKKKITEFICKSNLQSLYWVFKNTEFKYDSHRILKELKEPNLYNYLFDENIDEQIRIQLEYISNGRFIKNISYKIDKSLIEIRKHVDANRNVQFHIDELIYNIKYIYSFIKMNFLFYDLFDDFKVIVEKSIDGIFAAYSVQKNIPKIRRFNLMLGSYMEITINDFILDLCIFHCDTNILISIFKKYKIEELSINSDKLIKKAFNLCKSPELFDKYSNGNDYRSSYQYLIVNFENLLFLISVSKDNHKIKSLFSIIINLLEQTKDSLTLSGFSHFLGSKRKYISYEDLIRLLKIIVKDYKYDYNLIETIIYIHKNEYPEKEITDSLLFDSIIKSKSKQLLFNIWFIANSEIKNKVKQEIANSLQANFDFAQYINSSIYKIIPYEQFLSTAFEYVQKLKHKGLYEKVGNSYIADDYNNFNYLIQLIYTFNIDIPEEYLAVFEQYSGYHKFLLNPERFEYSSFKVEWLFVFQRKVYWEKFRQIEELKKAVSNELDKNFSNELAEIFHKHLK